jgi:hypothetical protein
LTDVVETALGFNASGPMFSEKNSTGLELCSADRACASLVVQFNMTNPEEHCNMGYNNWCLDEGGVSRYELRLASAPPAPIELHVTGEFLQWGPVITFTAENWNIGQEVLLVLHENLEITGNAYMNLVHTFTILNDDGASYTTRQPLLDNVSGWSPHCLPSHSSSLDQGQ